MKQKQLIAFAVFVLLAVALGYVLVQYIKYMPREVEVEGTVTWVDAENREASLEFVNPLNGELMEKKADVPEECELKLNGQPAELSDFRAGDQAEIKVLFLRKEKKIIPLSVGVKRETEATMPTTQPTS